MVRACEPPWARTCRAPRSWPTASKAHRDGMAALRTAPAPRHEVHRQDRPSEQHRREAQHRQRERCLGDAPDRGGSEQAEAKCRHRTQQQPRCNGRVGRQRTVRETIHGAKHAQHRHDHEEKERNEDRDLRRHVRADAQTDEAFAAHDRALRTDLQQPVGEPEEEGGKDDPEADHHHRARARVLEVEGTGPEENGEHPDDKCRRREQDRERQWIAYERLERPAREHVPLREPARNRALVHNDRARVLRRIPRHRNRCMSVALPVGEASVELRYGARPRSGRARRQRCRRNRPAHPAP